MLHQQPDIAIYSSPVRAVKAIAFLPADDKRPPQSAAQLSNRVGFMVCENRFAGCEDFALLHLGDKNTDQSNHKIQLKKHLVSVLWKLIMVSLMVLY